MQIFDTKNWRKHKNMVLCIPTKGRVMDKDWRGNCEIEIQENRKQVSVGCEEWAQERGAEMST